MIAKTDGPLQRHIKSARPAGSATVASYTTSGDTTMSWLSNRSGATSSRPSRDGGNARIIYARYIVRDCTGYCI
jgi:hypothetical protein